MKTLQMRNVPDDVHRRLKARAALQGQSLSEYALMELVRSLDRPTRADLLARISERPRVEVSEDPAAAVRAERDAR